VFLFHVLNSNEGAGFIVGGGLGQQGQVLSVGWLRSAKDSMPESAWGFCEDSR
ncbi:hypothetical protein CRENBAI_020760, partial [Crenichthys baileyi]